MFGCFIVLFNIIIESILSRLIMNKVKQISNRELVINVCGEVFQGTQFAVSCEPQVIKHYHDFFVYEIIIVIGITKKELMHDKQPIKCHFV